MTTRKRTRIFAIGVLLCLALALPVFAAEVPLGEPFIGEEADQVFWCSNGLDDLETPVEMSDFSEAVYLILEFSAAPADDLFLSWASSSNNWGMNGDCVVAKKDFLLAEGSTDTKLIIDMAGTLPKHGSFAASSEMFLFVQAAGILDLSINGTLTDKLPEAPGDDGEDKENTTNPQTGDSSLLLLALAALPISVCVFLTLAKTAKKA